jgi:N-methylhydantoinase A/oxoprolinase/acetone carboxylase beta subunit
MNALCERFALLIVTQGAGDVIEVDRWNRLGGTRA